LITSLLPSCGVRASAERSAPSPHMPLVYSLGRALRIEPTQLGASCLIPGGFFHVGTPVGTQVKKEDREADGAPPKAEEQA